MRGIVGICQRLTRGVLAAIMIALLVLGLGPKIVNRWYGNMGAITLHREDPRFLSGSAQTAAVVLERACATATSVSTQRLLGQAQYREGDHRSAIASFSRALQLDPRDSLSYYWRGMVYYSDARYEEAREDWARAGFLDYKLRLLYDQAHDLLSTGDTRAAEADLLAAVRLTPGNPEGYYALGRLYWGLPERQMDALAVFRAGIACDVGASFEKHWAEGQLHLLEKRWASAVDSLEQAAYLHPLDKDVLTQLGYAYWQNGQIEQAQVTLASIVQRWPERFDPYLYLSTIAGERGDAEQSILYMLTYLAMKPDNTQACDQLAQILSLRQNPRLTEWALAEMARIAPASVSCSSRLTGLLP